MHDLELLWDGSGQKKVSPEGGMVKGLLQFFGFFGPERKGARGWAPMVSVAEQVSAYADEDTDPGIKKRDVLDVPPLPTGPLSLKSAALTDVGRKRERNEDAFFLDDQLRFFLVVDGMGGYANGAEAARIAVAETANRVHGYLAEMPVFREALVERALKQAVLDAHTQIVRRRGDQPERMGATLVGALFYKDYCCVVHVGDSRAYLKRGADLRSLTRDHSWVRALVEAGTLTSEEADRHPMRHVVTQCLGTEGVPHPEINWYRTQPGDVLLLCSDGLTDMLKNIEISRLLNEAEDLNVTARRLVEAANVKGGEDNITVALVRVDATHA